MSQFVNMHKVELSNGVAPVVSLRQIFYGDVDANRIGAIVQMNGVPVALGGTCSGTAILADGSTVALTGTVSGNEAYVVLPAGCYSIEGQIQVFVKLTVSGVTTTLLAAVGTVRLTETDRIIDPGTIIPSVSALITSIEDAIAAIPADYSALLGSIAHTFSTSTAYTAGQYVWYEGELYRFNAAHPAGSWIGTDAARYTATDELPLIQQALGTKADAAEVADLKSALNTETYNTSTVYNPYSSSKWRVGQVNPTNGNDGSDSASLSLNNSTFFSVADGVTMLKTASGYKFRLFAYEKNGTFVGAWCGSSFEKSWNRIKITEFNIGAYPNYKFRVDMMRDDSANMNISEYSNFIMYFNKLTDDGIRGHLYQGNLAEDTKKIRGYLNESGNIVNPIEQTTRETTTDFISVVPTEPYTITIFVDSDIDLWGRICTYDSQKSYTHRYDFNASSGTWLNFNYVSFILTIPSDSRYLRVAQRHGFCLVTKGVTEWSYTPSAVDIIRHWSLRPKQDYFVKSINHRGYGRIAPENTAPAFELSADLGFWGVENDIRFTSDGVPVLLHDETINRTGRNADGTEISGDVYINQITYEQALTYDFGIWMGEQYAGTRIMTFEEFVSLCRKKSLHMYNEIKAGTEEQVASLVQIVKRYGMQKHCSWISFSSTYLGHVCRYDTDARIGLISSTLDSNYINSLVALKTDENTVFANIDASFNTSLTNALIDSLIENDFELEMWTPNFTSVVNALNPYVTAMTSDWCVAGDVLYNNVNNILVFD